MVDNNVLLQEVLAVVKIPEAAKPQTRLLRRGLIPVWAEGPAVGSRMINARAETVPTKPAIRNAFPERGCPRAGRRPLRVAEAGWPQAPVLHPLHDSRPFAFAGLWERWSTPDGQPIDSCTILTTVANDLIQPLHVRMPVIPASQDHDLWLDVSIWEVERPQPLLRPYPAEEIAANPVSTRVNDPANDSPEWMEPLR